MDGAKDNKLLSMHRHSPIPFSSDEGAESGDDSEEDIVTNYMSGSAGAPRVGMEGPPTPHHHHHHHHRILQHQQETRSMQQQPKQQQQPQASVQPAHAHGPPRRLVRMAEIPTMDSITAESLGMGVGVGVGVGVPPPDAFIPSIPTISITPHSPIAHKPFTVLDQSTTVAAGVWFLSTYNPKSIDQSTTVAGWCMVLVYLQPKSIDQSTTVAGWCMVLVYLQPQVYRSEHHCGWLVYGSCLPTTPSL
ncbi:hypothetical protein Pcinc_043468 [Petrolisthes cinctipes]|uniref:Uncharacterized protein n=1 Tax=Petrolisthes cinctipes TaxID=88211 RepID=A0AAE1EF15_PETCI|nr:hypothetical protein Pcinc_043468 [Petrolisthes cinctipes]